MPKDINGKQFRFGDRVRNLCAGGSNPQRDGLYVKTVDRGYTARGVRHRQPCYQFTDGKGKLWDIYANTQHGFLLLVEAEIAWMSAEAEATDG